MEWYGNAKRLTPGSVPSASGKAIENLLKGLSRRKQTTHIFSALFYKTHVKDLVDYSAYKASLAPGMVPMSEFAHRNLCIREAWEKATPDIREQVTEYKKLLETGLEELEVCGEMWVLSVQSD